jgi:spermidine synthase
MQGFKIDLPKFPKERKNWAWWFVKLLPGQMQAMHIDPHLIEVKDPVRYTLYLEDYHPGHIFVWDDKISSNYKAGDVYEWSDPMIVHGCVNISYKTRYTLQVTGHDGSIS